MPPIWQIINWIVIVAGATYFLVAGHRHRRALASSSLGLQRIQQAVESASEAIGIGDFQGNSLYHNRAHVALFGYSVEELNAVPGSGVLFADKATAKAIIAAIFAGRSWSGETDVVTKDGRRLPAFVRADIIKDAKGTPVGIFGLFRDVTRERQLAEEAARAKKLDSLGLMAGGIAHDFNNLLMVMLGQVQLAQVQPGSHATVVECLDEIEKVTLRAQDLTDRLRSFAKGENPSMALIHLPLLTREAVRLATKGSPIKPVYEMQESLPPVMADETQILQVLHNLALNAVQAMPKGGTLKVTTGEVSHEEAEFLALGGTNWVRVAIADSGIGIPPENLARVFEPFFTTKPKGTGLGLATCYSIVKKHSGHLKVESTPGVGTTFQMYLPASDLVSVRD
jgi:PAS domain S-box-containing protein